MSSYKKLTEKPSNNLVGDTNYDLNIPSSSWLPCDGSIVSQAAYPKLFNIIGLIKDNINNWNLAASGFIKSNALTYGNGVYVYGGEYAATATTNFMGGLTYSLDSIAWNNPMQTVIYPVLELIYGNGIYVYTSYDNVTGTSTNGINWITPFISTWVDRTSGTTSSIRALTYGNGVYVFAGNSGILRTSTNSGVTWIDRSFGVTQINALTYGNGVYVFAGAGGALFSSTNAFNWATSTSGTTSNINALTYGNGVYVYAGNSGVLASSTNAINWTARTSGSIATINALMYNSNYYYVDSLGHTASSTNAIDWSIFVANKYNNSIDALTFGNGVYVYVGGVNGTPFLCTSTDIQSSSTISYMVNVDVNLVYGNGIYLSAGTQDKNTTQKGIGASSTNAINWSIVFDNDYYKNIKSSTYGNGLYVYGGNSVSALSIFTSTNAINWTTRTSGTTATINALTYGNGVYVFAGNSGVLRTSTDAFNWATSTSGTTSAIYTLTYGNDVYVYGGSSGEIGTSTNANYWATSTSGTAFNIKALTYGNGVYVYGAGNDVSNSIIKYMTLYTYDPTTGFSLPISDKVIDDNEFVVGKQQLTYIKGD